jgi:polysaccharide biosynthesis protein VpsQ
MKRAIVGIAVLFVVAFVLIIVAADRGEMPPLIVALYAFPGGDKVGHFLLMGTLALLVNLSLSSRTMTILSRRVLVGSVLVAVVVTIEEFTQALSANRTFSLLDLAFSYAGIVCAGYLGNWLQRTMDMKLRS